MTSVLAYLLVVLLVPVTLSLVLFVMAAIEGEPAAAPQSALPERTLRARPDVQRLPKLVGQLDVPS